MQAKHRTMKRRRRRLLVNNRARQRHLDHLKSELMNSANPPRDLDDMLQAALCSAAPGGDDGDADGGGSETTQTASLDTDSAIDDGDYEVVTTSTTPDCSDTDTDYECCEETYSGATGTRDDVVVASTPRRQAAIGDEVASYGVTNKHGDVKVKPDDPMTLHSSIHYSSHTTSSRVSSQTSSHTTSHTVSHSSSHSSSQPKSHSSHFSTPSAPNAITNISRNGDIVVRLPVATYADDSGVPGGGNNATIKSYLDSPFMFINEPAVSSRSTNQQPPFGDSAEPDNQTSSFAVAPEGVEVYSSPANRAFTFPEAAGQRMVGQSSASRQHHLALDAGQRQRKQILLTNRPTALQQTQFVLANQQVVQQFAVTNKQTTTSGNVPLQSIQKMINGQSKPIKPTMLTQMIQDSCITHIPQPQQLMKVVSVNGQLVLTAVKTNTMNTVSPPSAPLLLLNNAINPDDTAIASVPIATVQYSNKGDHLKSITQKLNDFLTNPTTEQKQQIKTLIEMQKMRELNKSNAKLYQDQLFLQKMQQSTSSASPQVLVVHNSDLSSPTSTPNQLLSSALNSSSNAINVKQIEVVPSSNIASSPIIYVGSDQLEISTDKECEENYKDLSRINIHDQIKAAKDRQNNIRVKIGYFDSKKILSKAYKTPLENLANSLKLGEKKIIAKKYRKLNRIPKTPPKTVRQIFALNRSKAISTSYWENKQ